MHWIDYASPHSVREAVDLLNEAAGSARPIAGGTDVLVQLRANAMPDVNLLVDVKNIPGGISEDNLFVLHWNGEARDRASAEAHIDGDLVVLLGERHIGSQHRDHPLALRVVDCRVIPHGWKVLCE